MKLEFKWYTGNGCEIEFSDILSDINRHVAHGGSIFIGTDSMLRIGACTFASAICLHGASSQSGGRYFFQKSILKKEKFDILKVRIMHEVKKSIEIGLEIMEHNPDADVEIHVDIGSTKRSKTRDLKEMLIGWTVGAGFACKIKPHAWASASVADRHTK